MYVMLGRLGTCGVDLGSSTFGCSTGRFDYSPLVRVGGHISDLDWLQELSHVLS